MEQVPGRVVRAAGGDDVVARLASLSGSDFTTLMLHVAKLRSARETPASVLRRYRSDRFVQPAATNWQRIRAAEDHLAAHLPPGTDLLALPPLVPLGTHALLGPMSQDRVVTALRASEVAADPTNALALEAAVRRASGGPRAIVRLAAFQRVVRAQLPQPGYLPHFSLLGLVTAGRDDGGHRFHRDAVVEHASGLAPGLAAAGLGPVQLALTPLSDAGEAIAGATAAQLADGPVEVVIDRERQGGLRYYRDLCFKINVAAAGRAETVGDVAGGQEGKPGPGPARTAWAGDGAEGKPGPGSARTAWAEVGDGGFTDWAARLTASAKEHLLISGVGIDRLVGLITAVPQ